MKKLIFLVLACMISTKASADDQIRKFMNSLYQYHLISCLGDNPDSQQVKKCKCEAHYIENYHSGLGWSMKLKGITSEEFQNEMLDAYMYAIVKCDETNNNIE